MKRRTFLKAVLASTAGAAASKILMMISRNAFAEDGSGGSANPAKLARRSYGKIGVELSLIGLGGLVIADAEQEHANKVVAKAAEKGVNYFDVAPTYGDAEAKLGPALRPYRKNIFLACKTTQRRRKDAEAELNRSLERLQVDYVDLYQLHALNDVVEDVDAAFAKGGAMEAFLEAKKSGRVRFLGFSAHSAEAALEAMDRYDFDSVLFPINIGCWHLGNFGPQVVTKARKKNVAVLAIKAGARDPWPSSQENKDSPYNSCWYRPWTEPHQIDLGLGFALDQSITAAIPPCDEALFWMTLEAAMRYKPLTTEQQEQVKTLVTQVEKPLFTFSQIPPA